MVSFQPRFIRFTSMFRTMAAVRGVPRRRYSDGFIPYLPWSSLNNHIAHSDYCLACSRHPLPPYMSIPPLLELLSTTRRKLKLAFRTVLKLQIRLADLSVVWRRTHRRAFQYRLQLNKCHIIGMTMLIMRYMIALKRDCEHLQDVIHRRTHPRSPEQLWGRERERRELLLIRDAPNLARIMMYEDEAVPRVDSDRRAWTETMRSVPIPLLYHFTRV